MDLLSSSSGRSKAAQWWLQNKLRARVVPRLEKERMVKRQAQTKQGTSPLAAKPHLLSLQAVQVPSWDLMTGSVQSVLETTLSKRELGHSAAEVSSA